VSVVQILVSGGRRAPVALLLAVLACGVTPLGARGATGPGRQALQDAAQGPALQGYFASHASTFAGSFIDDAGEHYVVRFIDPPAAHADLRSAFAYPDALQIEQATYSLSELKSLAGVIEGQIGSLRDRGIDVVSVGVDQRADRVAVQVSTSVDAATAAIASRFDANRIVVRHGEPFVPINGRSQVGGQGVAAWVVISLSLAGAAVLAFLGWRFSSRRPWTA
jgi:hypothetical protein